MLSREEHENLINELMGDEVTHTRKAEILQELRSDNVDSHETHKSLTQERDSLKSERDDLSLSNSRLFRQIGVDDDKDDFKKKEEQRSFSETVTLESLGI